MFCTQCGYKNDEDMAFCTQCGAPLNQDTSETEKSATIATPTSTATSHDPIPQSTTPKNQIPAQTISPVANNAIPATPVTPSMGAAPANSAQQTKKKTPVIIGIVIVIVAALAAVAVYFCFFAQDPLFPTQQETVIVEEQVNEVESTPQAVDVDVPVTFKGKNYSPSTSTPIEVSVKGTSNSGESFSKSFYIQNGSGSITVPAGTYNAKPVASPLTGDGTLFTFSPEKIDFKASETGSSEKLSWKLKAIKVSKIKDSQINAAVEAADHSGVAATEITSLRDKVINARKKAKATNKKSSSKSTSKNHSSTTSSGSYGETWYVCADDFVTLRTSTSRNSAGIIEIQSRQPVKYISKAGAEWSKVEYDGDVGYVLTKFISRNPNAPLNYEQS